MLNLQQNSEEEGLKSFKILIYDKIGREIIAPLLKVGTLRHHGISLNLMLHTERAPVSEVPAIYFVEANSENILRITEDCRKRLYETFYVNFVSSVSRDLLELLAEGVAKSGNLRSISKVVDRYGGFASLSPTTFSLNSPDTYAIFHKSGVDDQIVNQHMNNIVNGLLSVIITLGCLPVIRAPPGDAAFAIATALEARLKELLSHRELSSIANNNIGRPVLIILDRDMDFLPMVKHTWLYQPLCHDLLGLKLNRIEVPLQSSDKISIKSYDMDSCDSFWNEYAGLPFPHMAEAVHALIEEYRQKATEMGHTNDDASTGLATAIHALPEMTEKKRSIDMHTNIATALLNKIKERQLDKLFEMEENFDTVALSTAVTSLEKLIKCQNGTPMDHLRAVMSLKLTRSDLTSSQLNSLNETLVSSGADTAPLGVIKKFESMKKLDDSVPEKTNMGGFGFEGIAGKVADHSRGLLLKGVKNILQTNKNLTVTRLTQTIMDQKPSPVTDAFVYCDPRGPQGSTAAPRIRAPFKQGIVVMIGGGSWVEHHDLQQFAAKSNKKVLYGCTDFVAPEDFVKTLGTL
eukprot:GHVL01007242.1.p1 GENE.GHVL01007242.1~~GHVL01007242.1.p1  ORF type:complete len:597 (-),score=91.09 GHVL01007242.1:949-2673(-)